jgi:hypothetical protein
VARGQFGNPGRRTSALGSRYQRTDERRADRVESERPISKCRLCKLAIAPLRIVITDYRSQ